MIELFLDIETFSDINLPKTGVYRYAESPRFEILMCAWAVGDDPIQVAIGRDEIMQHVAGLVDSPEVLKIAHNAQFERICFSSFFHFPVGEYLPPEEWEDSAVMAVEAGFPRKLEALGKALGGEAKDEAGTALINWFCKPDRNGNRRLPEDHPEKWTKFVEYCRQDVATHRDAYRKLPRLTPSERRFYQIDQIINDRGLAIDLDMAARAVEADERSRAIAGAELADLLKIENAGSVPQIIKALADTGLELPNMQSETLEELLAQKDSLTQVQRRALELRLETSLIAARKYQAALDAVSADGRLRGQYLFHGAHTSRWSSRGVQIHNLPNVEVTQIEEQILDLKLGWDLPPEVLKALLRSLFVGPLTVFDFKAIEACILAWLVGEVWVLEALREQRDLYVEAADRLSKVSGHILDRQQGKKAVLGLGYQGAVNALRRLGATGTDEELVVLVKAYREASPKTRRSWYRMEDAFIEGGSVGRLKIERRGKNRHLVLPSGHPLVYRNVVVAGSGRERKILFDDPKTGHKTDTYGGRLIENATQAVGRDLLAEAMDRLEWAGYRVVGHTHDEAIVDGAQPVDEISKWMCYLPEWAAGLPVSGKGFQCARYRKD